MTGRRRSLSPAPATACSRFVLASADRPIDARPAPPLPGPAAHPARGLAMSRQASSAAASVIGSADRDALPWMLPKAREHGGVARATLHFRDAALTPRTVAMPARLGREPSHRVKIGPSPVPSPRVAEPAAPANVQPSLEQQLRAGEVANAGLLEVKDWWRQRRFSDRHRPSECCDPSGSRSAPTMMSRTLPGDAIVRCAARRLRSENATLTILGMLGRRRDRRPRHGLGCHSEGLPTP